MTDSFSVDLDQVQQIIARLTGLAGFIADHVDQIDDKAAEMLSGTGWEGVASRLTAPFSSNGRQVLANS